jgi:hypothetical protein
MITRFPFLSFVLLAAAILSSASSEPINADRIAADAESAIERAALRADAAALAEAVKFLDAALAVGPEQPALVIEPNYRWVKFALLPSLDKPSPMR